MARKRKGSSTRDLQRKTLKGAFRNGMAWDDDEVSRLVRGIEKDETTYEMAMSLGRSYYGVSGTRSHVAFAMRHTNAIWGAKK